MKKYKGDYYKDGLDGWWNVASSTENPLWYYIYQLAYPDHQIVWKAPLPTPCLIGWEGIMDCLTNKFTTKERK